MSFWNWLQRKASAAGRVLVTNPGRPQWSKRNYTAFATEGYNANVVAYRAIQMVADGAAAIPVTAWRGETEITSHPVLDLLQRPNPVQGGNEFFRQLVSFLLISGQAYPEGVEGAGEGFAELWLPRPDRMKVVADESGMVSEYQYTHNNQTVRWDVDILTGKSLIRHLKLFNPINDFYGMSPLEAGAKSVDLHHATYDWMKALLDNASRPSGALQMEDGGTLGDEQYARVREQFEENHTGARNAGKPFIFEGGLKWVAMGQSPVDMGIIEQKSSAARDVALAIGVPPMMLGIPGDNTYSNYKEARLALYEDTIIPLFEFVLNELSAWLSLYYGDISLRGDTDKVPAIADKKRELWTMADQSKDLTINERRELKGYPPHQDGDKLLGASAAEDAEEEVKRMLHQWGYGG